MRNKFKKKFMQSSWALQDAFNVSLRLVLFAAREQGK